MNRIDSLFKNKPSNVLTIYFTAGYPNLNDTESIILGLAKSGVDLIEIGMPYSDPLADGPVIQASSKEALKNGMNLDLLFDQL
jgi:tryptophan synthase alpha chain